MIWQLERSCFVTVYFPLPISFSLHQKVFLWHFEIDIRHVDKDLVWRSRVVRVVVATFPFMSTLLSQTPWQTKPCQDHCQLCSSKCSGFSQLCWGGHQTHKFSAKKWWKIIITEPGRNFPAPFDKMERRNHKSLRTLNNIGGWRVTRMLTLNSSKIAI